MYHKGKNLVTIQTHKAQVNVKVVYLFHWGVSFVGLPTSRLKTGGKKSDYFCWVSSGG